MIFSTELLISKNASPCLLAPYSPSHVNKGSFLSRPFVETLDALSLFKETGQIRVGGVGLVSFPAASSLPTKGHFEALPLIDARDNSLSKETTNEI